MAAAAAGPLADALPPLCPAGEIQASHDWWGRPEDLTEPSVVASIRDGDQGADLLAAVAAALASAYVTLEASAGRDVEVWRALERHRDSRDRGRRHAA